MDNSNIALDVKGLVAGYGSRQVLEDVSFSVLSGQTYGLIGLNGVGKTTLIKIALGLKSATSGEIRVFGQLSSEASARADISYLPERFDPPWFLKGGGIYPICGLSLWAQSFKGRYGICVRKVGARSYCSGK